TAEGAVPPSLAPILWGPTDLTWSRQASARAHFPVLLRSRSMPCLLLQEFRGFIPAISVSTRISVLVPARRSVYTRMTPVEPLRYSLSLSPSPGRGLSWLLNGRRHKKRCRRNARLTVSVLSHLIGNNTPLISHPSPPWGRGGSSHAARCKE